jgi:hypothetical protein
LQSPIIRGDYDHSMIVSAVERPWWFSIIYLDMQNPLITFAAQIFG